jgi:hypothetical protein
MLAGEERRLSKAMKKKPYAKPGYIILDLTEADRKTLRDHFPAGHPAGDPGPEVKRIYAKIASQLKEKG